jgi:ATP-dependent Clp protease ATP-binding subunit ClpC
MFERYTEKARRVIFFARYEASQFGSPNIETEHMLLGLIREDKALTKRFLRARHSTLESIRRQVEGHTTIRESVSTSVDLPLSDECKRVLAFAAGEAEVLGHKHIGTEHLLLGLLREETCFAAEILRERGVQLDAIRQDLSRIAHQSAPRVSVESSPATEPAKDLTQAAMDGQLEPIVGRDLELESILAILAGRHKNNPLLLGERGVGKTAIVEGLAQRIADGVVPSFLAEKRILALGPELTMDGPRDRQRFEELKKLVGANPSEVILFIDDLQDLVASTANSEMPDGLRLLKYALLYTGVQCILTGIASDNGEPAQKISWFRQCFRQVHVRPLDAGITLSVLQARKSRLEKFHGVTYTEEALDFAVHSSAGYLPGSPLPGKAIELLDAAGSLIKLRLGAPPREIEDAQKHLQTIIHRMETAIANHEFEKARFYSDEEKKERGNLSALKEKHHFGDPSATVVGPDALREVISRWAAYPYRP